jgi:hypothetical protein
MLDLSSTYIIEIVGVVTYFHCQSDESRMGLSRFSYYLKKQIRVYDFLVEGHVRPEVIFEFAKVDGFFFARIS